MCNIMINMIDLSPNYTATIAGLVGAISSLGGFAVPVIVGFLTPHVSGITLTLVGYLFSFQSIFF